MQNPYKVYLEEFFTALIEFMHSTYRLNSVLMHDVQIHSNNEAKLLSGSALIISDWTGPSDNGWEINFHTGIFKRTLTSTYAREVESIISRECCLMYAQSFEALEKFIKDCLFKKASREEELRKYILSLQNKQEILLREVMPSGKNLFKVLKKAGGKSFAHFSTTNSLSAGFSELWEILSEVRHSITHSRSIIKFSKLNKSKQHFATFKFLFNYSELETDLILIELNYKMFDRSIKKLSEFAYQILKILSIEEGIDWQIFEKKPVANLIKNQ